jgi:hypothetical protein
MRANYVECVFGSEDAALAIQVFNDKVFLIEVRYPRRLTRIIYDRNRGDVLLPDEFPSERAATLRAWRAMQDAEYLLPPSTVGRGGSQ